MSNEALTACFDVLTLYLPGGTEETINNLRKGSSYLGQGVSPGPPK